MKLFEDAAMKYIRIDSFIDDQINHRIVLLINELYKRLQFLRYYGIKSDISCL